MSDHEPASDASATRQQSVAEILASLNFDDAERAKAWQDLQSKAAKLDEQLQASRAEHDHSNLWESHLYLSDLSNSQDLGGRHMSRSTTTLPLEVKAMNTHERRRQDARVLVTKSVEEKVRAEQLAKYLARLERREKPAMMKSTSSDSKPATRGRRGSSADISLENPVTAAAAAAYVSSLGGAAGAGLFGRSVSSTSLPGGSYGDVRGSAFASTPIGASTRGPSATQPKSYQPTHSTQQQQQQQHQQQPPQPFFRHDSAHALVQAQEASLAAAVAAAQSAAQYSAVRRELAVQEAWDEALREPLEKERESIRAEAEAEGLLEPGLNIDEASQARRRLFYERTMQRLGAWLLAELFVDPSSRPQPPSFKLE